jgi:hypothetical protein
MADNVSHRNRGSGMEIIPILVAISGGLFCALGIWLACRRS